jgi:hypothetical protein
MADPLSPATRATKRNLLIASVLAISANAFNISIDKIPLAGLSVNFDDRLFAFLLVLTLVYFLCTFVLYYVIDIKNLEDTAHQTAAEKRYTDRLKSFGPSYGNLVHNDLQRFVPPRYTVTTTLGFDDTSSAQYEVRRPGSESKPWDPLMDVIPREDDESLYAILDKRVNYFIRRFPRKRAANLWLARMNLYSMRATYFVRNYFFDGFLPIALGLFALIAILGHIDLHWIQKLLPNFKVLSP